MRFFHKNTDSKGFSLVETLIAIGILVTGISAPLTIAQTGLRYAHYAQDSLTAQMLTIEAIEYMRNVRDDNFIDNNTWTQNMRVNGDPFRVDTVRDVVEDCAESCQEDFISFDSENKLYSYQSGGGWMPSTFSRAVEIDQINSQEIIVRATVWWSRDNHDYSYTAREYLLNWHE